MTGVQTCALPICMHNWVREQTQPRADAAEDESGRRAERSTTEVTEDQSGQRPEPPNGGASPVPPSVNAGATEGGSVREPELTGAPRRPSDKHLSRENGLHANKRADEKQNMRGRASKSSVGATERQRQAKEWAYRQHASIFQGKQKHTGMHNSVHNRNAQQHARQHPRQHVQKHGKKNTAHSTRPRTATGGRTG